MKSRSSSKRSSSGQDATQRQRFIESAREAGASEDEAVFRENLKRLAQHKPDAKKPEGENG
jgi:hypothetical protein